MHGLLLVYVVLEAFTVCKVLEPLDDKYYKRIIYDPYSANSEAIHISFKPLDLSLVPSSIRLN